MKNSTKLIFAIMIGAVLCLLVESNPINDLMNESKVNNAVVKYLRTDLKQEIQRKYQLIVSKLKSFIGLEECFFTNCSQPDQPRQSSPESRAAAKDIEKYQMLKKKGFL